MEKVTDPDGVRWTVRRRWWKTIPWETGFDSVDALLFVILRADGSVARQAQDGALTDLTAVTEPQ